jgi:hypothetical protein
MKTPVHYVLRLLAVVFAFSLLGAYTVFVQRHANPGIQPEASAVDQAPQAVVVDVGDRPRAVILGTKSMNGAPLFSTAQELAELEGFINYGKPLSAPVNALPIVEEALGKLLPSTPSTSTIKDTPAKDLAPTDK